MAVCAYSDNMSKSVPVTGHRSQSIIAHLRWDHAPIDKYYAQTYLVLQPLLDEVSVSTDSSARMDLIRSYHIIISQRHRHTMTVLLKAVHM